MPDTGGAGSELGRQVRGGGNSPDARVSSTAAWQLGPEVAGLVLVLAMGSRDVAIPCGKPGPPKFAGLEGRD